MVDWRSLDPASLEAQLNPRAAVGNDAVEAYLEGYARRSAEARARMAATFDIRFGPGPKATLDLFRPEGQGPFPAFAFIHGGYWRALDKAEHHFVVEPAVRAGFAALVVNYDLCPAVTLDDIVAQMRAFMGFVGREGQALGLDGAGGLALAGHSAGAHLAAMLLHDGGGAAVPPVRWAHLASGIYEPEAARHISVNEDVRLTAEVAERNDALRRLPSGHPQIEITVGADEPPAWIGQSEAMASALRAAGHGIAYEAVAGADHFSLLDRPIVPPLRARP